MGLMDYFSIIMPDSKPYANLDHKIPLFKSMA